MGSQDPKSDTNETISFDLTAHFLIAMPSMEDEVFARSVVYLCEHSERGALGIVINKPIDLTLPNLFAKVDLPLTRADLQDTLVFGGGPLHTERGFVLHEKQVATAVRSRDEMDAQANANKVVMGQEDELCLEQKLIQALNEQEQKAEQDTFYASSMSINDELEMTTSKDVLEALSSGGGPRRVLISLGHAGWASGQLESELAENAWLHVKASPEVIFDTPVSQRYTKALGLLGLQEWMISRDVGRA